MVHDIGDMRRFLIPTLLLAAAPLAAQERPAPRVPPLPFTLTGEIPAALDGRYVVNLEPVVFGRVAVGLRGTYTTETSEPCYDYGGYCDGYPVPLGPPFTRDPVPEATGGGIVPCYECGTGSVRDFGEPSYRAWSFDFNVRLYPAGLSLESPRQRFAFYVGEYVGFHRRRLRVAQYPICLACEPLPRDTVVDGPFIPRDTVPAPGRTSTPYRVIQLLEGFEPGVEVGVRLIPARHFVLDVGGRWQLVRVDDPTRRRRPGDVEPTLVIAAGLSW